MKVKAILAEFIGAFFIVLISSGCQTMAVNFSNGIGIIGVSLALGLLVIVLSYALYNFSGANFNPIISISLWANKQISYLHMLKYILAHLSGAILAICIIYLIASGKAGFVVHEHSLGVNGYGDFSPAHYSLASVFLIEFIFSFLLCLIFILTNNLKHNYIILPLCMGMIIMAIYLISIPIDNGAVNPARSTASALLVGNQALSQLWVFWLAPILGALLAGYACRCCNCKD